MSGLEAEEMEHYTPQHPLPEAIKKMEKADTICRYCGVSYLIHNEIKALELKVKNLEKELEQLRGSEEREALLQQEVTRLQDQRGAYEMTITVKEAAVASLTNSLKTQEELYERLNAEKDEIEARMTKAEASSKEVKERKNEYERVVMSLKFSLQQQKIALEDINSYVKVRDHEMKEEMSLILSHVSASCQHAVKEREELTLMLEELQSRDTETSAMSEQMKQVFQETLGKQTALEDQLKNLQTDNRRLQEQCGIYQTEMTNLKEELEEAVAKGRNLQMETQMFKEQLKSKTQETEELTSNHRRKEQGFEMTTQKLKSDLKRKEIDLLTAHKEFKDLQNKFYEHQQLEEDLSRRASRTVNETKDLKESFFKAREEIENLKQEREVMITSHQNRIEQLRESFKEKLSEADAWPEKLEAAIQREKERHVAELRALENRLKESFVMELEIEKGKYQELMKKYQMGSKDTEEKLQAQLMAMQARYKQEIDELNELLNENRQRAKEMEEFLRREIESLKAIIRDLEARLGKLDVGNEGLMVKLKTQLKDTHNELEDARQELDKRTTEASKFQEEVKFLQDTVRKECEERLELTDALGAAKEELLVMKKPPGGYPSVTPRQPTSMSLSNSNPEEQEGKLKRTSSLPAQMQPPSRPSSSFHHVYGGGPKREYNMTNSNTMVFTGDTGPGQRAAGGKGKTGTLAENRRRIAAILGRKS